MNYSRLLNYLWRDGQLAWREYAAVMGERVTVVGTGEPSDDAPGVWIAAEIVVDGERRRGSVVVGGDAAVPDGACLRVVDRYVSPVLGVDDALVPQIECRIEPPVVECYDSLWAGAASQECAHRIAALPQVHRTSFYTGLAVERLRRKTERIAAIFEGAQNDWNQTFHTLLMQAMGGDKNKETFTELAARATATMASREKNSLQRVEALLLGTAGFLFAAGGVGGVGGVGEDKDDYTVRLEEEFRHMAAKYSIVPLKPAEWSLTKLYPANHPAVRLAEIAALLCKKDFMLDGALACRTSEDVEKLFSATASEYWKTHYKPSGELSAPSAKSIGRTKARLVGINLVAPLMFAYGRETGSEELCEAALDLLTTIPAEKNRKLDGWYEGGGGGGVCLAENGFESQALLELSVEYCSRRACADCRIGRSEIKKRLECATSLQND